MLGSFSFVFLMCCLPSSVAQTTLIEMQPGVPSGAFVGIEAVGWQQTASSQNVTISVPFFCEPPDSPQIATAYLVTSIGPGTTLANQVAAATITVSPSTGPSVNYVVFSGLDLPAGSYYLVVDTGSNGIGWSGNNAGDGVLSEASGFTYLGSYGLDGVGQSGYEPGYPVGPLSGNPGPASLNFMVLSQPIRSPVPGIVLSSTLADFSWYAVSGATDYQITVGTTAGGTDIFTGTTSATSQAVSTIPCAATIGGTIYAQLSAMVSGAWQVQGSATYKCKSSIGNYNGDGHQDVLWQNNSSHQVTVHYFDGTEGVTYTGWNWLNSSGEPSGWVLVGAADFDGNGVPDLVWEYMPTGQVAVDYYGGPGGATFLGWNWLNKTGNPGWTVVAVADMNGDGAPDLIWQNNTTNQVTVNYYGGTGGATLTGWDWLNEAGEPAGWRVVAAADFDGNGTPDLVWQYAPTRQVSVNYYGGAGGATYLGWAWLNSAGDPGWTVVGANDFNGDGVPDLVWQNDTTAQVTVNYYGGTGGATLTGWNWLADPGYPGWTAVVPR